MTVYTNQLAEQYVLEIISRSRTTKGRCRNLLSKDFPSEAPKSLAIVISGICDYLESATKHIFSNIDWEGSGTEKAEENFNIFKVTDFIVKQIASHIQYIDGAQTQKLPWSFIRPIEKLAKTFLSNNVILLVPQWDYNYSILTSNLYDYYLKLLSPYEAYDLGKKVTEVLTPLGRSFYVVFFPSIERKNILLHCALGHEIGHLKAREYLTDREQGVLQAIRDKIIPIVEAEIKEKYSDVPPLMQQSIYQRLAQSKIERATHAWRRGLEELLSDTVGTILFGPALLFSIFEITNQDLTGFDKIPGTDNNFYPSWRMRLRNILEALRTFGFYPLPSDEGLEPVKDVINAVNQRFKVIEDIVKDTKDKTSISEDSILKIAYDEIECDVSKARDYYKNDAEKLFGKTFNLYKDLPDLINRISFEIPPNACEKSTDDRRPSKIIEILNAAWFSRLAWEDRLFSRDGQFNDKLCEKRDIMNRLTLKALEYSDIEVDFLNALSNGKE